MRTAAQELLLKLIKSALTDEEYSKEEFRVFLDDEQIEYGSEKYLSLLYELYTFSSGHDLSHIPAERLSAIDAFTSDDEETKKKLDILKGYFEKALMLSVLRYHRIDAELKSITKLLEDGGVDFIPLKGSVLRTYYKNPKIRTSCDIDVLVRPEALGKCEELFTEKLNYKKGKTNAHDVTYFSESGVHIELHYSLMESFNDERSSKKLDSVWEYAYAEEGYSHLFKLRNEMFYFYHIAHMAKHFMGGGCGIKPYMDIWVMKNACFFNKPAADEILSECGLKKFSAVQEQLSDVWFDGGEHTDLTKSSEELIFSGGVYGNLENYITMYSAKRGSKFKYVMSRIFYSYDELANIYEGLKGRKWLTPFYQVRRWSNLIFKRGSAKRSLSELKKTAAMDKRQEIKAVEFMKSLELL